MEHASLILQLIVYALVLGLAGVIFIPQLFPRQHRSTSSFQTPVQAPRSVSELEPFVVDPTPIPLAWACHPQDVKNITNSLMSKFPDATVLESQSLQKGTYPFYLGAIKQKGLCFTLVACDFALGKASTELEAQVLALAMQVRDLQNRKLELESACVAQASTNSAELDLTGTVAGSAPVAYKPPRL